MSTQKRNNVNKQANAEAKETQNDQNKELATVSADKSSPSTSSILMEIGPLQASKSKQATKRGRKAKASCELTAQDNIVALKQKEAEKNAKLNKAPPAKRFKRKSTSDEDADFCTICLKLLPKKLTKRNSIKCNTCKRPVHLKCADRNGQFYVCKHCK